MGRQNNSPGVHHSSSSIALLQERFRQLQRMKDMREERDLLRLCRDNSKRYNNNDDDAQRPQQPIPADQHPVLFSHPHIHPSKPLHINSHGDCDTSLSIGLWPSRRENITSEHAYSPKLSNETEVDTSLHL